MPEKPSGSVRGKVLYWAALAVLAVVGSAYAYRLTSAPRPPTVEEYLAEVGEGAKLAPAGFTLSGVTPPCASINSFMASGDQCINSPCGPRFSAARR